MTYDQTMVIAWLVFSVGLFLGATMLFEVLIRVLVQKIGFAPVTGSLLVILLMVNLNW